MNKDHSHNSDNLLRRNRIRIILTVYFTILFLVFLSGAELILRIQGIKPYKPEELKVKIEPGGKLFVPHPTLGYQHISGKFKVTLNDGYTFTLTHLTNGLRTTRASNAIVTGKKGLWIMGCSFVHGWSLNDEDTYPYLVQSALPEYDVLNFGVNGYGVVQALEQFREYIKILPKPSIVVFNYAYFHDERNTFLRSWRKAIVPYNKLGIITPPYARFDSNGKVVIYHKPMIYREFPLQRVSAFAHFIEMKFNQLEDKFVKSHQVTKAVIELFAEECKKNGVEFILASITRGKINEDVMNFCRQKGIKTVDISVNLSDPQNRNLPYDDHPGKLAQKQYAEKLVKFLKAQTQ